MHTHACTHTHTQTVKCTHAQHTHTHAYTHTHIYTCINIHAHEGPIRGSCLEKEIVLGWKRETDYSGGPTLLLKPQKSWFVLHCYCCWWWWFYGAYVSLTTSTHAPSRDPQMTITHYTRTHQQDVDLCIVAEVSEHSPALLAVSVSLVVSVSPASCGGPVWLTGR